MLLDIKRSLETPLRWHDREFIIPADLTMGVSFTKDPSESLELKSRNIPDSPEELAKILEEFYNDVLRDSEASAQDRSGAWMA